MSSRKPEVAVVGDEYSSVNLLGVQVDQQMCSDVDVGALLFQGLDFRVPPVGCLYAAHLARHEGTQLDVDSSAGPQRVQVGLLTYPRPGIALTAHDGRALDNARHGSTGGAPGSITVHKALSQRGEIEPTPAVLVSATESASAVIDIESIYVRADSHMYSLY